MVTDGGKDVSVAALARLPEPFHATVSPDGERVAFYYDATGRNELHVLDRTTGDHEPLSDGEVPADATWHLAWADDDRVLFHRDRGGDEQNDVYAISLDGSVEPVVETSGQAIVEDVHDDRLLYASDEGEQLNLYRADLATGDRRQLTDHDQPAYSGQFSPDGDRIAYFGNESANLENRDVFVIDADGSNRRCLPIGADGSETYVTGWLPDGERLLVSDDADDRRQVGVFDLRSDELQWLGDGASEENARAVSPGGRYVLVTRERRGASMPVVYDLDDGNDRELDVPEGVAHFPSRVDRVFADESTTVFLHSTPTERKRLYEYDLRSDDATVLLAAAYGDVDPEAFVDAEYVTYTSDDLEIGALLYDARDGPGQSADATDAPGVVYVHGGPHFHVTRQFHVYVQALATQGYTVLAPNYRGSTGRGRAFRQAIHGDWGGDEQADVAAGGRWLMDREWIDADRVGVLGGSYGGYSVFCQLTRYPTRWAAGVSWVGFCDLHRLFEEDMPHYQHQLLMQMGDPEENYDLWRERSPIEHADRVERPLQMVHGVNDPRCPVEQSRLFRDALEERGWEAGIDFEYEELADAGHGSTDSEFRVRVFELMAEFLDRRL